MFSSRLLFAGAIAVGFVLGLAAFGQYVLLLEPTWSWASYRQMLLVVPDPVPPHEPSVDAALSYYALQPLAAVTQAYPVAWLGASPERWRRLIYALLGLAVLGIVWPFRRGARRATRGGRLASLSCLALLACTAPAAWKNDGTYHERMVHVPFCLALLLGSAFAAYQSGRFRIRMFRATAVLLAGYVLMVNARAMTPLPPSQSSLRYFLGLRLAHPQVQTFVFGQSEFFAGGFDSYDKLAALRIAFPDHVVISPGRGMAAWAIPPRRVMSPEEFKLAPPANAWLSGSAKELVAP
jgi:hypothetical protein